MIDYVLGDGGPRVQGLLMPPCGETESLEAPETASQLMWML
jgi:hypothetical protein